MDFNYDGPQKQLVFTLRFPVSYKNNQLLNQRVSFTNYYDWMGQVREHSLRPVMNKILELVKVGDWGLATNSVELKIFDLLKADDVLEVRLWLDKVSGLDNIYHLFFDWLRVLDNDSYERVACSNLIFTCVKIVGHGKAHIVKAPDFLRDFLNDMRPKSKRKKGLEKWPSKFIDNDLGVKILMHEGRGKFICDGIFQTSLEHSNLIGNIYFSNYSKWINATKDIYLYGLNPDFFRWNLNSGELVTLKCKVSYMQEAMPFDKIFVKMYLSELYQNGMFLNYEVLRMDKGGCESRLANVTQKLAFIKSDADVLMCSKMPSFLIDSFS